MQTTFYIIDKICSTQQIKVIVRQCQTPFILLQTTTGQVSFCANAIKRMIQVAEMTHSAIVYADYYKEKDGIRIANPTIEYQDGSLRDDFDFGPVILCRTSILKHVITEMDIPYLYAGLYDLRLKASQRGGIKRIPELLFTEREIDDLLSEEKQFDYVNPQNQEVQLEMERACTMHLYEIDALLPVVSKRTSFDKETFPVETTVVIPVKNRIKTIRDAIQSALSQQTDFAFNLLIVDNRSTDGTTEAIRKLARTHDNIVHLIPDTDDLGIGGCWNLAIMHPQCGKFAVQLDSDDLYIDDHVLQKITDAFYQQHCAMLIGSYRMVNFNLEEIPPGVIYHREWSPGNGHNNALRVNGLGAPRAFYTPIIRNIGFPNVSYGEDYAVGLAISRQYRIGRIYEPLYLCRRWDDNSDAALDINKLNNYNFYKDKIRTMELDVRRYKR